ncbi:MAG: DNA repair protein RecO [Burkholderiaceae bacterium]
MSEATRASAHSQARPHRRAAATGQAAFVLHRWDWSESSLILDLFTRESGRVAVAAKGAKRPYSQLRSVLLPFQRVQVQFGRTRGEQAADVHTLRGAEWVGPAIALAGADWFAGFYVNELLMRLLARDDPHPRLFDAYALALAAMSRAPAARVEAALRAFELMLLRETGVLPELDCATLTQQQVVAERCYQLRPEEGLVDAAPGAGALTGEACRALEAALRATLANATADSLDALLAAAQAAGPALKAQLRQLLHYHLAGATLRTREVMIDAYRVLGLDAGAATR